MAVTKKTPRQKNKEMILPDLPKVPEKILFPTWDYLNEKKRWRNYTLKFAGESRENIVALSGIYRCSPEVIAQVLLALLLCRYNEANKVVFGWVSENLYPEDFNSLNVGEDVLMIPLSFEFMQPQTLRDLVEKSHQVYEKLPGKQIFVTHKDGDLFIPHKDTFFSGHVFSFRDLTDSSKKDFFSLNFSYFGSKDDEFLMKRVGKHIQYMVEQGLNNPDLEIDDMQTITSGEIREIREVFNNTLAAYPREKTLHEVFCDQVEKCPASVAVICGDRQFTYRELNRRVEIMALFLIKKGIKKGQVVGIMLERSAEAIISILAACKAGAIAMPLKPGLPGYYLDYYLQQGRPSLLIATHGTVDDSIFSGKIVDPSDQELFNESSLVSADSFEPVNCQDHVFLMFTSGSTGEPSGVLINHRAVLNGFFSDQKHFNYCSDDVFLHKSSLTFVTSFCEIFSPLLSGGKVVVMAPDAEKDMIQIARHVQRYRITYLEFVPSMLEIFLDYIRNGCLLNEMSSLKVIFSSGEVLKYRTINVFNSLLYRQNGTRLFNSYGLTETSVDVTMFCCSDNDNLKAVSIGKPIDNVRLYILDKRRRIQPVGVAGNLWVAGEVLGSLLNDRDCSDYRYILHPEIGESIFNTGDRARWLPDGSLEFLGRDDFQFKIRGHRVAAEEIERNLQRHEGVRNVAVSLINEGSAGECLCAFIVSDVAKELTGKILKEFLSEYLPSHMVPVRYVFLKKMPLNLNGKIDRRRLAFIKDEQYSSASASVLPGGVVEIKLLEIWKELFDIDDIGVEDDFFAIGGHSLMALILHIRIQSVFKVEIPLELFFPGFTIRKLAEHIEKAPGRKRRSSRNVTILSPRRSKQLFCFAPVVGFGLFYQELGGYLQNYTVYGLDFISKDSYMQDYLGIILQRQEQAPFYLLGYSAGGNLAFEITVELERLGLEVASLIILDSQKETGVRSVSLKSIEEEADYLYKEVVLSDFQRYVFSDKARKMVKERLRENIIFTEKLINNSLVKADLHYIAAERESVDPGGKQKAIMNSWEKLTSGAYSEYQGCGDHYRMLHGNFAAYNSGIIARILKDDRKSIN